MKTVPAKTILSRSKHASSWFGGEYNMNLYRGCVHGCIYCDSRSDCYQIADFDTVAVKENALTILRDELSRKAKTGVVATGAMSDPYNPAERQTELTCHALELLSAYGFGCAIATKSDLITRDVDVLQEISTHNPVLCKITITTPNDALAAQIEPAAPSWSKRFAAVEQLAAAGIFTGILLMPVLPWLTDNKKDILTLINRAANSGARFIYPGFGVTMRSGQREYFLRKIEELYPEQKLAEKYQKRFHNQYHCASPRAKSLWEAFTARCAETGLLYNMQDIIAAYRQGYGSTQLSFF